MKEKLDEAMRVAVEAETIGRVREIVEGEVAALNDIIAAKDAEIAALRDDLRIVQELNGGQAHEIERLRESLAAAREDTARLREQWARFRFWFEQDGRACEGFRFYEEGARMDMVAGTPVKISERQKALMSLSDAAREKA